MKTVICPKCKSEKVKLATPRFDEDVYFICEKCNYEKKMPNDEITRTAWFLQRFSNEILALMIVKGEITAKNIIDIKNIYLSKVFYQE